MIRASQWVKLAIGLLVAFAGSARIQASDITFDFTSGVSVTTSFSKSVSGYTLTISNPVGSTYLDGGADGLSIGDTGYGGLYAFNIQVSGGPLVFKNYEVGRVDGSGTNPFDLSGGTGESTGNLLSSIGVFNYNGSMLIAPGDTVLFNSPGTTDSMYAEIKYMTFSTVPEPSTYAMGAIATGIMAAIARHRRRRQKRLSTT